MYQNDQEMSLKKHQDAYVCRCLFERVGDASYVGHLDLMHTMDRAIRRAQIPLLYSQGYNPRPMLVFALPLGVGIDTVGDYVDVSLSQFVNVDIFIDEVNKYLPNGVRLIKGNNIEEPSNSLMSVVTVARYRFEAPRIKEYMERLFSYEELLITKNSKGKLVETDIRPLLISGLQCPIDNSDVYECYVYAGSVKNLRPDVLLRALCEYTSYDAVDASNCKVTRIGLYGGDYPRLLDIMTLL